MTATTETREPEIGLTFEKVWAMFQESDRRMREMREETDRQLQETARQIREMNEETNRKMKETDKRFGALDNRFGELAEHLVGPNIMEKFNALGFHFTDISTGRRKIITGNDKQRIAEFDILMENGESSVGVEVKSKLSERDVKDHVRRLEILRRHKDTMGDKRKIYGALAGAIMTDSVRNAALKAGMYAITQTGDTVKIDIPEDFIPKAW
ncbi:MAG: hypothetical protein LBS35_03185 [Synergistaceae bacterium]|jgi:hypothetical protein|nr:hypothetical protein [Synergistaceae bacterium]